MLIIPAQQSEGGCFILVCQGAITTGYASDVTDDAVQANVVQVYHSAALKKDGK